MITGQTANMEDYLEAIAKLSEEKSVVRVTEISERLGVKKPSVTAALHRLSEEGLVEHPRYGRVKLTREGQRIARDVIRRHEVLYHFLKEILGVESDVAQEDACNMEHLLSADSLERLAKFVEFILETPQGEPACLKGFNHYLKNSEYLNER